MVFSKQEQQIGERAYKKILNVRNKKVTDFLLMDFSDFLKYFSQPEKDLINKIINFDCKNEFNSREVKYGIKKAPQNIVLIDNQKYRLGGKTKRVQSQYLPKNIYRAFLKMNKAMTQEIGRSINVVSGYRSGSSQMIIFLYYLNKYQWKMKKALKIAALPGWSEHANPKEQGLDLAPVKGIVNISDFYKTKEYKWLNKNAAKFGFYLSYEPNNKKGVIFEPWHWHYRVKKI